MFSSNMDFMSMLRKLYIIAVLYTLSFSPYWFLLVQLLRCCISMKPFFKCRHFSWYKNEIGVTLGPGAMKKDLS